MRSSRSCRYMIALIPVTSYDVLYNHRESNTRSELYKKESSRRGKVGYNTTPRMSMKHPKRPYTAGPNPHTLSLSLASLLFPPLLFRFLWWSTTIRKPKRGHAFGTIPIRR